MGDHHEPTLPQNPYKLAIRQHIFPRCIIERFTDHRNLVEVVARNRRPERLGPKSDIFITKRKWDQKAEHDLAELDRAFASLVQKCSRGPLPPGENEVVTRFYASWRARWHFSQQADQNAQIKGIAALPDRDQDFQEQAESVGCVTFRIGKSGEPEIASRFIYGGQMTLFMDAVERGLGTVQWRCRHFPEGTNLLVPDVADLPYIPISPNQCLYGYREDDEDYSPEQLNQAVRLRHKKYYFRSLV